MFLTQVGSDYLIKRFHRDIKVLK